MDESSADDEESVVRTKYEQEVQEVSASFSLISGTSPRCNFGSSDNVICELQHVLPADRPEAYG